MAGGSSDSPGETCDFSKVSACIKRALEKEEQAIGNKRAALDAEQAALRAEKAAMGLVGADDDILELNVGGRCFITKRGTLTQGDHVLSGMFSGRWEGSLRKDAMGRFFLDFDPDCFEVVLHEFRKQQISGVPPRWACVSWPANKKEYARCLLSFLALHRDTSAHKGETGAGKSTSSVRQAILALLRDDSVDPSQGLAADAIAAKLSGMGPDIKACLKDLVAHGEIFNSIDESHFLAV
mmetsp:Transcript_9183/g.27551  ORF Transcript_9183/g.27551 Transcript_9183/m.27551 type:complete len:238 (-) Transcript_9183:48-761(-)